MRGHAPESDIVWGRRHPHPSPHLYRREGHSTRLPSRRVPRHKSALRICRQLAASDCRRGSEAGTTRRSSHSSRQPAPRWATQIIADACLPPRPPPAYTSHKSSTPALEPSTSRTHKGRYRPQRPGGGWIRRRVPRTATSWPPSLIRATVCSHQTTEPSRATIRMRAFSTSPARRRSQWLRSCGWTMSKRRAGSPRNSADE